jgi:hypothetical protein
MRQEGSINKAQSTLEYILVIIAVIAIFVAIAKYYQRSLQSRFRQAADVVGGSEQNPNTFKLELK